MKEVNELFVPENKLNLAAVDATTLPIIKINKVIHDSQEGKWEYYTYTLLLSKVKA